WNKSNAGMGSLYRSKHELVFVYRVGMRSHLNMVELGKHGRNRTNVWDYASINSMRGSRREDLALHPTVKPTGLVADAIQDVTRRGDLVLDLFLVVHRQQCHLRFQVSGSLLRERRVRHVDEWEHRAERRLAAPSDYFSISRLQKRPASSY